MIRSLRIAPLFGLFSMTAACTTVSLGAGAGASGCGPGGANQNQHSAGDQPGGVRLAEGDIAVAPDGSYVIFQGENRLSVGWPATGEVQDLPVDQPTRLAFSKKRDVVYVGSAKDTMVHAVDVKAKQELWAAPIEGTTTFALRLASSGDDARLVVAGDTHVAILDAATGAVVARQDVAGLIADVAILPDDARVLVVPQESWSSDAIPAPSTKIAVIALGDGATHAFEVPNCASTLTVTPGGERAFLSPTSCNKDPVSLLDLTPGAEAWVKNLPGFGPLALGPDGTTAVAFLDLQNLDEALFDDPSLIPHEEMGAPRFHIMTIDTKSLAYGFTPVGDALPRYALTPDGDVLLVDSSTSAESPLRLFDTKTHGFRVVHGPNVQLDDFVITSDARHIYALSPELIDVDVAGATAAPLVLTFVPRNINLSPDDQTLFLRSSNADVCVYSLKTRECKTTFAGGLVVGK